MCNSCSCDFQDNCSIVGKIPLGFCCPKCENYNDDKTCIKLQMNVENKIPVGLKAFAEKKVNLAGTNGILKDSEIAEDS